MYQFRLMAWMFAVIVAFGVGGAKVGIIAALIAFAVSWSDRENVFGFAPFLVVIEFKPQFFVEGGIASESQLLAPPPVRPPTSEYWPRRDGIRFTVLRLGLADNDGNLIYWNNHHTFSSGFHHFVPLNEFEHAAPATRASLGVATTTPSVEIEQHGGELEMWASSGLTSERKRIAVIPNCMFDAARLRKGKLTPRSRNAALKRHGWMQDEPTDLGEHGRIPGDYQHRLLTVGVRYV